MNSQALPLLDQYLTTWKVFTDDHGNGDSSHLPGLGLRWTGSALQLLTDLKLPKLYTPAPLLRKESLLVNIVSSKLMRRSRMTHLRDGWRVLATATLIWASAVGLPVFASDNSTAPGRLVESSVTRVASLTATALQTQIASSSTGQELLQLSGSPTCGVDVYHLEFWTVGGAGEATLSSGALMVPTGTPSTCSGPRPRVLYSHSTQTNKAFDIANLSDSSNTEGALIAVMFAAQGYLVIAPNYAGYDISTLGYHPFLNAEQQSGEMIDILAAAHEALPGIYGGSWTDNGQLFITGYSEGGFVAMATQRALQAAGQKITAVAPMSGPYAVEAFGDTIFSGGVDVDSTVIAPLMTTSYQHAYRNIYKVATDVYASTYAKNIETVLPNTLPLSTLFADGLLPESALFDSTTPVVDIPEHPALSARLTAELAIPDDADSFLTPVFDTGFGAPFLVINRYREQYALEAAVNPDGAAPTLRAGAPLAAVPPRQNLRRAFYVNDLRNGGWAPNEPTLLCGGDEDPTVFFSINTQTMATFWADLPAGRLTVLDVNATPSGPFAAVQSGFQSSEAQTLAFLESAAGGGLTPAAASEQLVQGYHLAVAPFCTVAARSFFSEFLTDGAQETGR